MHVMRGELLGFFENRLDAEDRKRVLRHLLSGCRACRQLVGEVFSGEVFSGEVFSGEERSDDYDTVFWRLMTSATVQPAELQAERLRAREQWSYLKRLSAPQRLLRLSNDPSYFTYGLYERILESSRELVRDDPAEGVGVARLALAVAERLDGAVYGELTVRETRSAALAALGNAQRVGSDFDGAAASLAEAERLLVEGGAGDPLDFAHLHSLTASLKIDLGQFESALESLGKARAIYERLRDRHMIGRIGIKQGLAIGFVDPERGIELLAEAHALIDSQREPRLELSIRHSTAIFLCDLGRPQEALDLLQRSAGLYQRFGDRAAQVRRSWLEAKIQRGLGRLTDAQDILTGTAEEVLRHGMHQEYVLMMIDLAEIHFARGRHTETLAIVDEVYRSLQGWGMHDEGLAVLLLAVRSIQEQTIQKGRFRELATYMRRAWNQPQGAR